MPGHRGKDVNPRTRRESTSAEKQRRADNKSADRQAAHARAKAAFVANLSSTQQSAAKAQQSAAKAVSGAVGQGEQAEDGQQTVAQHAAAADVAAGAAATADRVQSGPAEAADTADAADAPRPVERPGDDVECVDIGGEERALDSTEHEDSVMQRYARKILERLRTELSKGSATDDWLLRKLRENGWWLRTADARDQLLKLSASSDPAGWLDPFYLRDIFVWLPDIRWGEMPTCPRCLSNADVHVHDYQLKQPTRRCRSARLRPTHGAPRKACILLGLHCTRACRRACRLTLIGLPPPLRVTQLKCDFHVMSRRYRCDCCRKKYSDAKRAAELVAAPFGLTLQRSDIDADSYTFMPWHPASLSKLSHGRSSYFEAFLTARGGVSTDIIDQMRPLFNAGVKPATFAKMVLELQTKTHARRAIEYEHILTIMRASPEFPPGAKLELFSTFGDQSKYAGVVPNGSYFQHVHEEYHDSIAGHLDTEVKKRGAERLHWDVSYKEAKHLARYHGSVIFKGLVTATNEVGEIRVQFHVVTDGFDQFDGPVETFHETLVAYGHTLTTLLGTDNPSRDASYFLSKLPGLRARQAELDGSGSVGGEHGGKPVYFTIDDPSRVAVVTTVTEINSKVGAIRESMLSLPEALRVISLDAEWDVNFNPAGHVIGSERVALVQLGYRLRAGDTSRALLIRMQDKKKLPERLEALLKDVTFMWTGRQLGGDLNKIGRDFGCMPVIDSMRVRGAQIVELGSFAARRKVVVSGARSPPPLPLCIHRRRRRRRAQRACRDLGRSALKLLHLSDRPAGLCPSLLVTLMLPLLLARHRHRNPRQDCLHHPR